MTAVLDGAGLRRTYRLPRRGPFEPGPVRTAVDGVDLTAATGARLGILGESGSGKSTLVRLLAGLEAPSAGTVTASGRPVVASGSAAAMRWFRRETGVVFQ
ncbi:ATP-binding cassette domain-containing protein, partial [Clavibacter michiganensis]|uniref:ATP-binding cassette domain-containing protein n=1 Tax=Clavibacter michiganensis TaxID=28447 RepID=UPI00292EDA17